MFVCVTSLVPVCFLVFYPVHCSCSELGDVFRFLACDRHESGSVFECLLFFVSARGVYPTFFVLSAGGQGGRDRERSGQIVLYG